MSTTFKFNEKNFEKVIEIDGAYSAISMNSETVLGFGGITAAKSVMIVTKDEKGYNISLFVKNEWGDRYALFGDYTYTISNHHINVVDADWKNEEEVLNENFLFPLYFNEGMKDLFADIVRYLTNK